MHIVSPRILNLTLAAAILVAPVLAAGQGNPIVGKFSAARNAKISKGPADTSRDFIEAKTGQSVREGFAVRTSRRSFAEITFTDGSAMRINEQTDLIVQSAKTLRRIRLNSGEVWVKDENGSRTAVQTPVATATARGTEFTVSADGKVSVSDGEVELTNKEGKTLVLGPGDIGGIGPGGQPIKLGAGNTPGSDNWYQKAQQMPQGMDLGSLAAVGAVGAGFGGGGHAAHPNQAVPEPATLFALTTGLGALLLRKRARR